MPSFYFVTPCPSLIWTSVVKTSVRSFDVFVPRIYHNWMSYFLFVFGDYRTDISAGNKKGFPCFLSAPPGYCRDASSLLSQLILLHWALYSLNYWQGKRKGHPMTCFCGSRGHADVKRQPTGTRRWVGSTMLRPLYPQEVDALYCTVGWVGLVANLEGTEDLAPIGIGSPKLVAIPTALFRPPIDRVTSVIQ
jgi:hypothetical protein